MSKFHVNGKGEAGKCSAEKGGCPFGGENEHYTSKENARKAYEAKMGSTVESARKTPHYTTVERAFENLPLAEEARIYKILTDKGVEYLPWRGREEELTEAYEPWKTISYEEAWENSGKLKADDDSLRAAIRAYDRTVKGTSVEGYAVARSEAAAGREALANYRASTGLSGFNGKDCYAVLKKAETTQPSRPSLMKRIFSRD